MKIPKRLHHTMMGVLEGAIRISNETKRARLTVYELAAVTNYGERTCRPALTYLRQFGFLDRPHNSTYVVTERGRIAWALWSASLTIRARRRRAAA